MDSCNWGWPWTPYSPAFTFPRAGTGVHYHARFMWDGDGRWGTRNTEQALYQLSYISSPLYFFLWHFCYLSFINSISNFVFLACPVFPSAFESLLDSYHIFPITPSLLPLKPEVLNSLKLQVVVSCPVWVLRIKLRSSGRTVSSLSFYEFLFLYACMYVSVPVHAVPMEASRIGCPGTGVMDGHWALDPSTHMVVNNHL